MSRPNRTTFILLLALIGCTIGALNSAEWLADDGLIPLSLLGGFALGALLAWRNTRQRTASFLLIGYALLIPFLYLASLWPLAQLRGGWAAFAQYTTIQFQQFMRQIELFESNETALAFLLGIFGWLLAAAVGWWGLRDRRPMRSLMTMGVLLCINAYWSDAAIVWIVLYIGIAFLLYSHQNQQQLGTRWLHHQQYAANLQHSISTASGLLILIIMLLAYRLPMIDYGYWLNKLPGYRVVEARYEAIFGDNGDNGRPTTRQGIMPRHYLLDEAPELLETVMMTATVSAENPAARHWRALSFDVYTGEGWTYSDVYADRFGKNERLKHNNSVHSTTITQTVTWLADNRVTLYSLGEPASFDQGVVTLRRDDNDLFRVQGQGSNRYTVVSKVINAPPTRLRSASNAGISDDLQVRYTQLPPNVPQRVQILASEIISGQATMFDQVKAIETYLRQYPYDLAVEPPPEGADPVDYFLFDAQRGYCDYYASAMVVLARSVGLPARMGVGYLAQSPDENGVQTIRQLDAHTWAEVYFAGVGWIEFEPTAAFPVTVDEASVSAETLREESAEQITLPLPGINPGLEIIDTEEDVQTTTRDWRPFAAGIMGIGLLAVGVARRLRGRIDTLDEQYKRLQRRAQQFGVSTPASQTPSEFKQQVMQQIGPWRTHWLMRSWDTSLLHNIEQLANDFAQQQYAKKQPSINQAHNRWRRIRRPLRWLTLWHVVNERWEAVRRSRIMRRFRPPN